MLKATVVMPDGTRVAVQEGTPQGGRGQRGLGIPNVVDRVVQQAVLQVLEPVLALLAQLEQVAACILLFVELIG